MTENPNPSGIAPRASLYAVFVRYPFRDDWSLGSANTDLESAGYRLNDHSHLYGGDSRTEGYILDVDRGLVVARFLGGPDPVTLTARQFCPLCCDTFGRGPTGETVCPKCRDRLNAE